MAIILRSTKGSPLTHSELDGNFTALDSDLTVISTDILSSSNAHDSDFASLSDQIFTDRVTPKASTSSTKIDRYNEGTYFLGNSAGATTIDLDWRNGNFQYLNHTNPGTTTNIRFPSGSTMPGGLSMTLIVQRSATASVHNYTIGTTSTGGIVWTQGDVPDLSSSSAGTYDVITAINYGGGTNTTWFAFLAGKEMS